MKDKRIIPFIQQAGIIRLNKIVAILLFILTGMISNSCIYDDRYDFLLEEEQQYVTLSLALPATGNTRATTDDHEFVIESMHVLLFDTNGKYYKTAPGRNIETVNNEINRKKFQVDLPIGDFDMILIANCEDIINAAIDEDSGSIDENSTKAQVAQALKFAMAGKWELDPLTPFPMWGQLEDVEVTKENVIVGGSEDIEDVKIPMLRSVVRIDIKASNILNSIDGSKLVNVRLYNRYTQGQVIPDAGTFDLNINTPPYYSVYIPSLPQGVNKTLGPLIYDFNSAPVDEVIATIYTFEAKKGDFNELLENTCLVLGIGEKDPNGGATRSLSSFDIPLTKADDMYNDNPIWYYRVDFVQEVNGVESYLPLLRNHNYVVTVKEIINRGFPDPDQAFRSEPYLLKYEVTPYTEIELDVTGDTYRLDITGAYISNQSTPTNLVYSSRSGEQVVNVTTTHPEGWYFLLSEEPDRIVNHGSFGDWITLWPSEDEVQLPDVTTEIYIQVRPNSNPFGTTRIAYMHIISGNLTNVIQISQEGGYSEN